MNNHFEKMRLTLPSMYETFVTTRQNTIKYDCSADKFLKSPVDKWNPLLSKWLITALDKTVAIPLFWI